MEDIEIVRLLTETEQRSKSNTKRIDDLEKRQDNLDNIVTAVEVLSTKQTTVENDVKEIKADVKTLTAKPGKRWDGLVDKIILTLAAAVIGYLLARWGLT